MTLSHWVLRTVPSLRPPLLVSYPFARHSEDLLGSCSLLVFFVSLISMVALHSILFFYHMALEEVQVLE
jgi:hypothetical protein